MDQMNDYEEKITERKKNKRTKTWGEQKHEERV